MNKKRKKYTGRCVNGKRCKFTLYGGKRVDECIVCGCIKGRRCGGVL